jgi:hypothetical protein
MADPFANDENKYISSLVLTDNLTKWREIVQHETRLLKQEKILLLKYCEKRHPERRSIRMRYEGGYWVVHKSS